MPKRAATPMLCALAMLCGACSTPATPARTAYFATASADAATTIYGVTHGYSEVNPAGPFVALALKGGLIVLAERVPEPWRSRLYWLGSSISVGCFTNNMIVLTKPATP